MAKNFHIIVKRKFSSKFIPNSFWLELSKTFSDLIFIAVFQIVC